MKRLLLLCMGAVIVFAVPAKADPGPSDEVVVIAGNCDDGTTIVSAHNTQDKSLGYLIRIDGRLVEQGRLAPGERVQRTYEVPLGESHFYRISLGRGGNRQNQLPEPDLVFDDTTAHVDDAAAHVIVELQRKLLDVVKLVGRWGWGKLHAGSNRER